MQFIILVVQELREIQMPKILTSEIANIHTTHRFRNPLCENLIVSRGY